MSTSTAVKTLADCPDYMALANRVVKSPDVDPESLVQEYKGKSASRQYGKQLLLTGMPLMIGDLISLTIAFWTGIGVSTLLGFPAIAGFSGLYFAIFVGMFASFLLLGLYSGGGMHPVYEFRQTCRGTTLVFVLVAFAMLSHSSAMSILLAFPFLLGLVPVVRSALRRNLAKYSWWGVKCVVFAQDRRVNALYQHHQKNLISGLRPIGFVQDSLPDDVEEDMKELHLGKGEAGIVAAKKPALFARSSTDAVVPITRFSNSLQVSCPDSHES